MYTLRQYLIALEDPHGLTRTLGEVDVCRNQRGGLCYTAGNSAIVFRIRHQGRIRSLRCYTRPGQHLDAIYGERLLRKELYLHTTPNTGEWTDVVLGDWIEGTTLSEAIWEATNQRDIPHLKALSEAFDRLSAVLVADLWAHGDLKPDNIIVASDGTLHLIDFDAQFLPSFAGEASPELGTAAFQHPMRTKADFDASLDDYPAALIATALHALVLDPTLHDRYHTADGLLFEPAQISSDAALGEAMALFEQGGHAAEYRIARLLLSPSLHLCGLSELLVWQTHRPPPEDTIPALFVANGLWGYRTPERIVIPPLYDCGFDFSENLAAVRLGATWHYIDPTGRTVLSCPSYEAVKPFRNGRATILCKGHRRCIDPSGRLLDI